MKAILYKLKQFSNENKEEYVLCSGDDFHNKNLQPNDLAYHRGSKEILKVLIKNELTGSWGCNDGTSRDSYKLFKVLTQSPDFSLLEDAKRIGWFDVEGLAYRHRRSYQDSFEGMNECIMNDAIHQQRGYVAGFQKHAELTVDRMFTEDDIKQAYYQGRKDAVNSVTNKLDFINPDDYIKSISQPKSWEVEYKEENGVYKILSIIA